MIFWDTSALVPLLVEETRTGLAETVARRDGDMLVWWGTTVEVLSAIARLEREERMDARGADATRAALATLSGTWSEVLASEQVRTTAARLLRCHALRAADALQLGAALTWADGATASKSIFTFDARLAEAARREGFRLIDLAG